MREYPRAPLRPIMEAATSLLHDTHARLGLLIAQADGALAHLAARERMLRRVKRRARGAAASA